MMEPCGLSWLLEIFSRRLETGILSLKLLGLSMPLWSTCPQTRASYNASKAAVVYLAKNIPVEWADLVSVNCVSPGYILTESRSPNNSAFNEHDPANPNDSGDETAEEIHGQMASYGSRPQTCQP